MNRKRIVFIVLFSILVGTAIGLRGINTGPQQTIRLERILTIDSEGQEHIDRGLSDIDNFAVGRNGQIYVLDQKNEKHAIFLFDAKGNLQKTFGGRGQGPGEFQSVSQMIVANNGDLIVRDKAGQKLIYYGHDGAMIKEKRTPSAWEAVIPLENGHSYATDSQLDNEKITVRLRFYDEENREVKTLDEASYPNTFLTEKIRADYNLYTLVRGRNRIYFGAPSRDDVIKQYDEMGNLLREIHAGEQDRDMTDEFRSAFIKKIGRIYEMIKTKLFFPKFLPPFHSFAAGQGDELAIMTYEWSEPQKSYKYALFSSAGERRGYVFLDAYYDTGGVFLRYGDRKIYCLREKPSGYKEICVFSIL